MAKKISYGLTDFVRIRTEDYYYIDKTHDIELLEQIPSFRPKVTIDTKRSHTTPDFTADFSM